MPIQIREPNLTDLPESGLEYMMQDSSQPIGIRIPGQHRTIPYADSNSKGKHPDYQTDETASNAAGDWDRMIIGLTH